MCKTKENEEKKIKFYKFIGVLENNGKKIWDKYFFFWYFPVAGNNKKKIMKKKKMKKEKKIWCRN